MAQNYDLIVGSTEIHSPNLREIPDLDRPFRKARDDIELAAHRFHKASQIADVHVGALFHLGDGGLPDINPIIPTKATSRTFSLCVFFSFAPLRETLAYRREIGSA